MEAVGAVVGIADVALRTTSKLWTLFANWQDAPADLHRLRDELWRTHRFFSETQDGIAALYSAQPRLPKLTESHASIRELEILADEGMAVLGQIDRFIDSLTASPSTDKLPDFGKRRKIIWMASTRKVNKWRSELRAITSGICRSLIVQNIPISTEMHLSIESSTERITSHLDQNLQTYHNLTVSKLGKVVEHSHADMVSQIDERFKSMEAKLTQPFTITRKPNNANTKPNDQWANSPTSITNYTSPPPPYTPKATQCPLNPCPCACHAPKNYALRLCTPLYLLGTISLLYNANAPKCTLRSCSPAPRHSLRLTYTLPTWLLRTTLYMLYASPTGSPQLVLRVQNHIPAEAMHPHSIFGRVQHGDIPGVKALLLANKASVTDIIGPPFIGLLNLAIWRRDIKMVSFLLSAGADPFQENPDDQGTPIGSAFLQYIQNPRSEICRILPMGVYVEDMEFPRLSQILMGTLHVDLAKALGMEDYRKDINNPGLGRQMPLDIAVIKGDYEAVKLLIDAGADVEGVSGVRRTTALHRACMNGDVSAARMLLEAGASVETRERNGWDALVCAATCPVERPDGLLRLLLRYGADVHAVYGAGWQPLSQAVTQGTVGTVEWFLDHGADIEHVDCEGDTAVCEAIFQGWCEKAEVLIRRGCRLDGKSRQGRTLLHYLARDAEADMMEVFMRAGMEGVNPGDKDHDGKTATMVFREREVDKELEAAFEALMRSVERLFWGEANAVDSESEDEFVDARDALDC